MIFWYPRKGGDYTIRIFPWIKKVKMHCLKDRKKHAFLECKEGCLLCDSIKRNPVELDCMESKEVYFSTITILEHANKESTESNREFVFKFNKFFNDELQSKTSSFDKGNVSYVFKFHFENIDGKPIFDILSCVFEPLSITLEQRLKKQRKLNEYIEENVFEYKKFNDIKNELPNLYRKIRYFTINKPTMVKFLGLF